MCLWELSCDFTETVPGFQCQRINKPNLFNFYENNFRQFQSGFDILSEGSKLLQTAEAGTGNQLHKLRIVLTW
jgi:hypothetical protein